MTRIFFTLIIILFSSVLALAQRYTISGFVEDADNGERMIYASIYDEISQKGTLTNVYGFFSLTLNQPEVKLLISFVGYNPERREIKLTQDVSLNIKLKPNITLKEVTISDQRVENQIERTQMSVTEIPVQQLKSLPVLLGETDIIKMIQLMPGVQSGSEGSSGLYVRGGGPDQNLILLDGVPVYNADHLFGFFSVFNTDAIQNATLIKGGFPARYGGRLSSVLDIRMKEGNNKEIHGAGSIGIISSKLMVEGPLKKEKSSFIISGRRTYIDILTRPIIKAATDGTTAGYYFWDLNGKINYTLSEKDRIYLSMYGGRDKAYGRTNNDYNDYQNYTSSTDFGLSWGNVISAFRWNRTINPRLFMNVTGTFSSYNFKISEKSETSVDQNKTVSAFEYKSGIRDWSGKLDFDYHPSPNHVIMFGGNYVYHTFIPGITLYNYSESNGQSGNSLDTTFGTNNIYAHESYVFVEDEMKIGSRISINAGLHYSMFFVQDVIYPSLQPRFSIRYMLHEEWSIKAAYSSMTQNIHLLTNSGIGLPTDLWLPATKKIAPQKSQQVALGVFHDLPKGFEVSLEGYYKDMSGLIEYKEGADFFGLVETWENKVETGKGQAYGVEFLIRKNSGKTTGWIGYTLSWSNRQFDNLNFGKTFPYRYDRRHDLSLVVTHNFTENIDAGLVWVYGTGTAVSLPIEQYPSTFAPWGGGPGMTSLSTVYYYDGRNQFRTPAYHRLDLSVNLHKQMKRYKRTWSFGIYNVYNRKNPFFIYFEDDYQGNKHLKQISLFPMIPSVSYSLIF